MANREEKPADISEFAVSNIPDRVERLTPLNFDTFAAKQPSRPHVYLFSDKEQPSPLYKATTLKYMFVFGDLQ
jgi:hypothetical protein